VGTANGYSGAAGSAAGTRLQGGVEVPTGGKQQKLRARERFAVPSGAVKVSRSGAMPEPTVTVRMKEDVRVVSRLRSRSGGVAARP